ncbi:MAG: hypothetical protein WCW27_01065 [Patescibacteria group bacterium]|jgi:4-amino-4-deoxy-L-arabinose transferase-like glycosyltransferase
MKKNQSNKPLVQLNPRVYPGGLSKRWLIFDISVVLLLSIIFGWLYGSAHAWGAWSDDAPGYIYTAGQFFKHEPLVTQSSLVQSALTFFGNEPWARLAAPTHHEIISPSGWIASRYPIGLGALMYLAGLISGLMDSFYVVVPALAVLAIIFTYLLSIKLFLVSPIYQRLIGLIAAVTLGFTELYSSYAVSQPMREIPALTFFLLALLLIVYTLQAKLNKYLSSIILLLAGASYGYSINIRETFFILFPVIILLLYYFKPAWQQIKKPLLILCLGIVVAGLLSIWNSGWITLYKEKFKAKDITSVAITSNFDHIESLSVQNLYDNEGKYKRGVGGVLQYIDVLQTEFAFWPLFLFMAVIGLLVLWNKQRKLAYLFISWFGLIFLLFSAWINPYARYILPLFPVVTLLAGYGVVISLIWLKEKLKLTHWMYVGVIVLMIGSLFITLQPLILARIQHVQNQALVNKAISKQDLQTLKQLGVAIKQDTPNNKPPLLLMIGDWQSGIAEMIMTHDSLPVIRYPRKAAEQPPVNNMVGWLTQLSEQYQLYLWYDDSASNTEQQLRAQLTLEELTQYDFSFQQKVVIYKIK